jgi:hypothetical protein
MLEAPPKLDGHERNSRIVLMFLQADIDIAFSLLHLAEVEAKGGDIGHAAELTAKAILSHKTITQALVEQSFEYEEACGLRRGLTDLLEAIQTVERGLQVLLADPVPMG